jgi:hypothetical protein
MNLYVMNQLFKITNLQIAVRGVSSKHTSPTHLGIL